MSSLVESGLFSVRVSRLLQSRRFPAHRSLQTQFAGDALPGNHLGLPFSKDLGVIRVQNCCMSIGQMSQRNADVDFLWVVGKVPSLYTRADADP